MAPLLKLLQLPINKNSKERQRQHKPCQTSDSTGRTAATARAGLEKLFSGLCERLSTDVFCQRIIEYRVTQRHNVPDYFTCNLCQTTFVLPPSVRALFRPVPKPSNYQRERKVVQVALAVVPPGDHPRRIDPAFDREWLAKVGVFALCWCSGVVGWSRGLLVGFRGMKQRRFLELCASVAPSSILDASLHLWLCQHLLVCLGASAGATHTRF